MTTHRWKELSFSAGAAIYAASDTADCAYLVRTGWVSLRAANDPEARRVGPGAVFGAEHVASRIGRGETATAATQLQLAVLPRLAILRWLNARQGIDVPAAEVVASAVGAAASNGDQPTETSVTAKGRMFGARLHPGSVTVAGVIGQNGVQLRQFPVTIGRETSGRLEAQADIKFTDDAPYTLSRRHFEIRADNGRLILVDCGSQLGTWVNGTHLSSSADALVAPLPEGDNQVIAGGPQSPFRFRVVVERPG